MFVFDSLHFGLFLFHIFVSCLHLVYVCLVCEIYNVFHGWMILCGLRSMCMSVCTYVHPHLVVVFWNVLSHMHFCFSQHFDSADWAMSAQAAKKSGPGLMGKKPLPPHMRGGQ